MELRSEERNLTRSPKAFTSYEKTAGMWRHHPELISNPFAFKDSFFSQEIAGVIISPPAYKLLSVFQ